MSNGGRVMQTIIHNDTNMSAYIFEDDVVITAIASQTTASSLSFIIGDMKTSNSTIYTGVTPPEDWDGCKYCFDGTTWTENPNWKVISPMPEE